MTLPNKYIGQSSFRIGLGYTRFLTLKPDNDILRDPSYFDVSFFNTEYRYNINGSYDRILYPIPYDYCNDTFFEFIDPEVYKRFELETHLCASSKDFYLVGDLNSKVHRDIEILITPCSNGTGDVIWKSREEINEVIVGGFVNTAMTRSYFDFDDFENPVKTFLSDSDNHYLLPNATTWVEYFLQENTALTSDNLFYSEPFKETKFYDIATEKVKTINNIVSGGAILLISIGPYPKTIQYERTVYWLLDLFGYLGGLYDFMLLVGFWFVNGFQEKIYQNLISSNMYQVKSTKEKDESGDKSGTSAMANANSWFNNSSLNIHVTTMRRINQSSIFPEIQSKNNKLSMNRKIDSIGF